MSAPTRILVVDDNAAMCQLIQDVLTSAQMDAHGMTDSAQAAERLKHEKFDAVFLDMRMPPPDGIELAKQIRSSGLNQSTPIVVITGEGDHDLMERAFRAGATFFLHKPIDRSKLLRLIRVIQPPIQHERRRFRRVKAQCKVLIKSGSEQLDGVTLDLSLNGMLVKPSRTLPVGSLVQASLELWPTKASLRVTAHVMRMVGKDCMGLCLDSLALPEYQKLQDFLLPLIAANEQESS